MTVLDPGIASDTLHAFELTPPGRGAIATILVCGPGATDTVQGWFQSTSGRLIASQPIGRILFGCWRSADLHFELGEELVVCRRGTETVEIHCHGGRAAVTTILNSLSQSGCRAIEWREFLQRFSDDPIAIAATQALTQARTARTAAILLDQRQGALREALMEVLRSLDSGDVSAAEQALRELASRSHLGMHLTAPFRVVLAGPPNVGKSSLINALVGYQRAIVFDQPGTTRDVVTATTAIDGWPIELSDTAGLRAATDHLEAAGVALAHEQLAKADCRVLVFDTSEPWGEVHSQLVKEWMPALVVFSKCDLRATALDARPQGLSTSVVTGEGIADLVQAISTWLVADPPTLGDAVPFTTMQKASIESAIELLARGNVISAQQKIAHLLDSAKIDPR